ncbi:hypothetical protein BURMUCF2_1791 [Burkholderia multivorans CF2]|nr:hypothetical protein BURMUCF2_1791 [Burkholderia multivorans CF2]
MCAESRSFWQPACIVNSNPASNPAKPAQPRASATGPHKNKQYNWTRAGSSHSAREPQV